MDWLKNLRWLKTAGLVLAAILMALAGAKVTKRRASATKKEDKAVELMNSSISTDIQKGKKMVESANKDKDKAVEAEKRMEAQLENMGNANEDIAAIADRFNKRKLRKSTVSTST